MKVNLVVQHPNGYVYLGGGQGLVRYDGSNFELFSHNPDDTTSIGHGEVYNLIVGSDGLIWLALRFGGLNSFDPKTGLFRRYPLPKLPYFMITTAHGLFEDENGCIWVGGHHFQLLCLDRKTGIFSSFQPDWIDPEDYGRRLSIVNIIQDATNPEVLWLSVLDYEHDKKKGEGGYGFVSYNKGNNTFTSYPNTGRIVYQDSLGFLYGIRVINGVSKYSTTDGQLEKLDFEFGDGSTRLISRGIIELDNEFWVTTGRGIMSMNKKGEFETIYKPENVQNLELNQLYKDNSKNIWIANTEGAVVVNPRDQHIRFFSLDQFDAPNRIYPGRIAYDVNDDVVYLAHSAGNSAKRLYRIPSNKHKKMDADFIEVPTKVTGLAFDEDNQLWLSGGNHLYKYNEGRNRVSKSDTAYSQASIPWLWNLRTSSTGWIGGAGDKEFIWFNPHNPEFNSIVIDDLPHAHDVAKYDEDFVGFKFSRTKDYAYLVSGVVHRLNLNTSEIKLLHYDSSINPNGQSISDVEEDADGNLWMSGVTYIGKFKIDGDSLILLEKFTVQRGLASSEVHEIFVDLYERVWLFTPNGLNCIDTRSNEVRYFGVNEGLPQIYIDPRQVIQAPDGRIITVNGNGIIVFHPDSLWNSLSPVNVSIAIDEIRVNGVGISSTLEENYLGDFSAPMGNNVIDIRFQGLAYPNDDNLVYSYRLSENENWIDIGASKLVTLPSLAPGDYTFEVKAGTSSSKSSIRQLQIHIPTPYYKRSWFLGLALFVFLSGIYAFYRYRIKYIRKQESLKTDNNKKIAELELKALRSQINPHFMFNSLNSIKDFILQANPEKASEYLSDFAHLIRRILQNSHEKSIPLGDEIETLILYINLEKLRFDNAFNFSCIIDETIDLEHVQIPPMLLQPYIENAIWHGLMHKEEEGSLTLEFKKMEENVVCVIDDDGIGRARAKELKSLSAVRYKSMGMGITKDRIEILNRLSFLGITIEIIDKTDELNRATGTRVLLTLPVSSASMI